MNPSNPATQFLIIVIGFLAVLVAGHIWHAHEMKKDQLKKVEVEK